MADIFGAPIPGQSLTDEPRNYAWERPPEIVNPDEAVKFHLDGLNKPETLDNLLMLLQMGMPIKVLTKGIITTAQMEGIHSVDVGLIVRPVVREELITIAEEAGIDYVLGEGETEEQKQLKRDQEIVQLIRKELDKIKGTDEDDSGAELMRQSADMLEEGMSEPEGQDEMMGAEPAMEEAPVEQQQQEEMPQPEQRGLMARG